MNKLFMIVFDPDDYSEIPKNSSSNITPSPPTNNNYSNSINKISIDKNQNECLLVWNVHFVLQKLVELDKHICTRIQKVRKLLFFGI